jgi:hypothetical protein
LSARWHGVVSGLRTKRNNRESACREKRKYDSDKSIFSSGGDHEGEDGHKHQYVAKQYLAKPVGLKSLHLESLHNEVRRILPCYPAEPAARIGKDVGQCSH